MEAGKPVMRELPRVASPPKNSLRYASSAEAEKSFEDWRVGGLEGSRIKDKDGNSGLESEWATIME